MLKQEVLNLITGVYIWFNQIADPTFMLNKQDLEKYFTPDFVMNMNEIIRTKDYDSLYRHFQKFRQSDAIIKVSLPLKEIVISDDFKKCVARYTITKTFIDKSIKKVEVIAIWHISNDGRLQRMNEVVYSE